MMKIIELIEKLKEFPSNMEVRIMDVTKEEVGDETYCPTFDFDVEFFPMEVILHPEKENISPFIALEFNPEEQ